MARPQQNRRTEPAHGLLHEPARLTRVASPPDTAAILGRVTVALENPFNERQIQAFSRSFLDRVTLLWGPPGTGKTTVLTGIILGWLERAWQTGRPVCVGVGSSNYNAIDNVLLDVADLIDRRRTASGEPSIPVAIVRVKSDSAALLGDPRIEDVERSAARATELAEELEHPGRCLIVGGTWMQLGKLAQVRSADGRQPVAAWFDLLLIDEASQVKVSSAAAFFLLCKERANVVLAGDHRQLGPIYGFQMKSDAQGLYDCIFTYMQAAHGLQTVALDRNYRTNSEISGWPRARFYSEGYEAFHPRRRLDLALPAALERPPSWPEALAWSPLFYRILDPAWPVIVVQYDSRTYTLSNPFESQMVAALSYLYRRLIEAGGVAVTDEEFWAERLGIVTPHRAQMSNIRNLLVGGANMPMDPAPVVDTVDRFQGQERDLIIASYSVADRDFVRSEEAFILNPRRFNVTLTRARSKFVMFVSDAIVQHLPSDAQVARDASHLQLFVENYCSRIDEEIGLPYFDDGELKAMRCRIKACDNR